MSIKWKYSRFNEEMTKYFAIGVEIICLQSKEDILIIT